MAEPEAFAGRAIGCLIGGRPVRLVYKEEQLQQNVFPRFKQAFQAHGCDEVGDWWELLCAILFGGDVSLQGPKYINRKTYNMKTFRQKFMRSHRDLVVELMTIVFNEQANIPFRPISQPTSFKEFQGRFEFDTSTAKRKATIIYRAVDKQPDESSDDVYRVIIHGEGKENLFTNTFRFQPSQFWISARYQTGAAAPATSDEDSSVGAGEDACEEVKTVKGLRLQGSASDEVRRLRPVDNSDDDEARTPRTRSRVGPLGVGAVGPLPGGGSRRRQ
jgi:hypothetical protein